MDYNFNLKHDSQRKFKMSPFLQPPGFERCFSTSSKMNLSPCGANNLAVNPLHFVNFISGMPKHNSPHSTISGAPTVQAASFSGPSSMSVSCFVSGFVGSPSQNSSEYCNGLLLDVLLNEISTLEKTAPSSTPVNGHCFDSVKSETSEVIPRRTYAEVAKIKPKPLATKTCFKTNSDCDTSTRLHRDNSGDLPPVNLARVQSKSMDFAKPHYYVGLTKMPRKQSCSSSSDSSLESVKRNNRTLSECSADSDDSYIVFENDDEAACLDCVEDGSDDSGEGDHLLPSTGEHAEFLPPAKSPKKVTFKADDELVTVHLLIELECESRAGPWEQYARDRVRFQNRIRHISSIISPILSTHHREIVYQNRFMTT